MYSPFVEKYLKFLLTEGLGLTLPDDWKNQINLTFQAGDSPIFPDVKVIAGPVLWDAAQNANLILTTPDQHVDITLTDVGLSLKIIDETEIDTFINPGKEAKGDLGSINPEPMCETRSLLQALTWLSGKSGGRVLTASALLGMLRGRRLGWGDGYAHGYNVGYERGYAHGLSPLDLYP